MSSEQLLESGGGGHWPPAEEGGSILLGDAFSTRREIETLGYEPSRTKFVIQPDGNFRSYRSIRVSSQLLVKLKST